MGSKETKLQCWERWPRDFMEKSSMFLDYKLSPHPRHRYPHCVNMLTWRLPLALPWPSVRNSHIKDQFNKANVKTGLLTPSYFQTYSGDSFS